MKLLQRHYIVCLLAVAAFILPKELFSQFTYLEAGLGNTNVVYSSRQPDLYYHNMSVRLSGLVRFKKHIGVGGELNVPVLHHNRSYSAGGIERYFKRNADSRYLPQEMDYTFQNSISGSLFARFFVDSKVNLYGEVRFSVVQMQERFVFSRDSVPPVEATWTTPYQPGVDAVYIDETIKHLLFAPGLALGIQPRIGKKFFINFKVGVDFYFFNDNNQTIYQITNKDSVTSSYKNYETIRSYGVGVRFPIIVNLGFGYFF